MVEYHCPHCKSPLTYTGATSAGEVLLYCAQCNKQIEFADVEEDIFSTETKEESDND